MRPLALVGPLFCAPPDPPLVADPPLRQGEEGAVFVDVAQRVGLDFVHFNGMSGEYYFPEMTGQGGAFLDHDGDGDLDVYLVQGAMLGPEKELEDATFPAPEDPPRDRLFRNHLEVGEDGERRLRFVDATEESGIRGVEYGMGVACGDYDGDGRVDLHVTNYGPNRMWRNGPGGVFSDTTAEAGVGDERWSTSAAFADLDRDGFLDLFVVNYVDFPLARNPTCYSKSSRRDYCGPSAFDPVRDRLFQNGGDGTFEDVAPRALVGAVPQPGLGVVAADLDGNGWLDLCVANDGRPNQCWMNQEDGKFRDEGLLSGVAYNRHGRAEASMGIDAGDFDADGDEDLFMTHLLGETNTVYVNQGKGLFEDRSVKLGLATPSHRYTAFGTAWFDYDNDGWLDVMAANGAVGVLEPLARAGDPFPLRQPNQLFRNLAGEGFEETTERAGAAFGLSEVSRGTAFGDVDDDGDTDVLVFNNCGPVRLLENRVGSRLPWLGLRLVGGDGGRDMLGARVAVERSKGPVLWRRARTDGSYCSASDPRVLVGLGDGGEAEAVEIHWPDGTTERWEEPVVGRYTTLRQGEVGARGR